MSPSSTKLLRRTSCLVIAVALLHVPAAVGVSPAGDEVVSLDFVGIRVTTRGLDEAAVLGLTEDQVVDAHFRHAEFLESRYVYDGVIWGTDDQNVVGQWYCRTRDDVDRDWKYFDSHADDQGSSFPFTTRVMGTTRLFSWHGHCHQGIDVRLVDDPHAPWFQTDVKQLRTIFAFSTDWRKAFEARAATTRPGTLAETTQALPDGGQLVRRSFVPQTLPYITCTVLCKFDSADQLYEWAYLVQSDRDNIIDCDRFRIRPRGAEQRALPARPEEIVIAHSGIDLIQNVTVRDWTGLGRWTNGNVQYMSESLWRQFANEWMRDSMRIVIAGVVFFVVLAALLHEHVAFNRRTIA